MTVAEDHLRFFPAKANDDSNVVRRGRPAVKILAAVVLLFAADLVWSSIGNENFRWHVIGQYLFSPIILNGLWVTLWLTAVTMLIGIALGILLAVMKLSGSAILFWFVEIFVWLFRGVPVLVQLMIWYNLASLFPTYSFGLPFLPPLFTGSTNDLISPYTAALLALGLNEGAYMCEIIRAGILSVNDGQEDAARALGMRRGLFMRRIILPQAMRFIVPPTGNQTINMLKVTSIVSIIALFDLTYSAQSIYSRNYETIPLLMVASFWYLVVTSVLTLIQLCIERHFRKGRASAR